MSIFKNITNGDLYLASENGVRFKLNPGEEFTGSNFYKRYAENNRPKFSNEQWVPANLKVVRDDGQPWPPVKIQSASVLEVIHVKSETEYSLNVCDVIGGLATYIQVSNNGNSSIELHINKSNSGMIIRPECVQIFSNMDIFVSFISIVSETPIDAEIVISK